MKIIQIKKWIKMLSNKSILHAKKGEGLFWSKTELGGFYIDYSAKVNTRQIAEDGIPYTRLADGRNEKLPITVIQYGLGSYEKYLETEDKKYLNNMLKACEYMCKTQNDDGSWDAFKAQVSHDYLSSMVQGEGVSLLLRAYKETNDEKYLKCSEKAYKLLLTPVEQGGTAVYNSNGIILLEGTNSPPILNGWIYSLFCIYDYFLLTGDCKIKEVFLKTISALKTYLPKYDLGFWSKYSTGKPIASPFYHELHITQLSVMYKLTEEEIFLTYSEKFNKYYNNKFYYALAFFIKAVQKVFEKSDHVPIIE